MTSEKRRVDKRKVFALISLFLGPLIQPFVDSNFTLTSCQPSCLTDSFLLTKCLKNEMKLFLHYTSAIACEAEANNRMCKQGKGASKVRI